MLRQRLGSKTTQKTNTTTNNYYYYLMYCFSGRARRMDSMLPSDTLRMIRPAANWSRHNNISDCCYCFSMLIRHPRVVTTILNPTAPPYVLQHPHLTKPPKRRYVKWWLVALQLFKLYYTRSAINLYHVGPVATWLIRWREERQLMSTQKSTVGIIVQHIRFYDDNYNGKANRLHERYWTL